jgi:hypothetical protein
LLVARNDPLDERESVCFEDFSARAIHDVGAMTRDMMDAFTSPVTPSCRRLRRVQSSSSEDTLILVAAGKLVH